MDSTCSVFVYDSVLGPCQSLFLTLMASLGGRVTLLNTHRADVSGAAAKLELLFLS